MAYYKNIRMRASRAFSTARRRVKRYTPRKKQMKWLYIVAVLALVYIFFKDKIHSMLSTKK